jgi:hypothetical protein
VSAHIVGTGNEPDRLILVSVTETPQAIVYEASVRSISRQQAALDNLRSRAGTLLAAAAIVTSFLGAEALKDPGRVAGTTDRTLQAAELVAVGAFIGLAISVISILWPRKFVFSVSAADLLGKYIEIPEPWTVSRLERNLSLWLERHFNANQKKLSQLFWAFRIGCFLLAIEVVAWIVDLTENQLI